ncbi:MAG TPA: hypothetical protein PKH67_04580 [Rhodocyclaceae bacterium]|jgi:hypothetical protein|nr:hypothetical protein [Rhodocyclaceae bacterium]
MLTKAIHFAGATIAMSLIWLLALIWLAQACCNRTLEGAYLILVASACTFVAAIAAWKIFVRGNK